MTDIRAATTPDYLTLIGATSPPDDYAQALAAVPPERLRAHVAAQYERYTDCRHCCHMGTPGIVDHWAGDLAEELIAAATDDGRAARDTARYVCACLAAMVGGIDDDLGIAETYGRAAADAVASLGNEVGPAEATHRAYGATRDLGRALRRAVRPNSDERRALVADYLGGVTAAWLVLAEGEDA